MELTEPIETINQRLSDLFGKFENGQPNFRVVWANDEFELRHGTYNKFSESGLFLGTETGVRQVPKYYTSRDRYVLERLTPVPPGTDLTAKLSYEPVWTFQDTLGNYLPPNWEAIFMIVTTINANIAAAQGHSYPKYVEPVVNPETEALRIKELANQLYGNETSVGDALSHDSAVGYGERKRNDSRFTKLKVS